MAVMKLQRAIECGATAITLLDIDPSICPALTAGGHALLTVYTTAGTESIIATKCSGSTLTVVRADNGRAWPAGACVKLDTLVSTPVPSDDDCGGDIDGISFGPEFDTTQAGCSLNVHLKKTGVVAGDYCGFQVNEFGQILDIPDGWPAACLPVFNPCGPCDSSSGGGTGGATAAYAVTYTPQTGATVALAANVQSAMEQLEDAIVVIKNDVATSVQQVMEGPGIVVTGLVDYPVVALSETGVAEGVYAGFTVDKYGRITAYTSSGPAAQTAVDGQGAISVGVDMSGAAPRYTVSVADASINYAGVVKITDLGLIQAGTVTDGTSVPNFDGTQAAITKQLNAKLAPNLPTATALQSSDLVVVYRASDHKLYQATPDVVAKYVGPPGGVYDVSSGTLSASRQVGSVQHVSTGVFRVTLTTTQVGNYHISATAHGAVALFAVARIVSATSFDVQFFALQSTPNATGGNDVQFVAADPGAFSFVAQAFG